ncbi:hypothetical protein HDE_03808 [Halotydeus destructor]|nr:hypothetical protein HDE_03808 [Halotydeus destructor]
MCSLFRLFVLLSVAHLAHSAYIFAYVLHNPIPDDWDVAADKNGDGTLPEDMMMADMPTKVEDKVHPVSTGDLDKMADGTTPVAPVVKSKRRRAKKRKPTSS